MKKEPANLNLIELEHSMLDTWEKEHLVDQIIAKNKGNEMFRFLDGPITANNRAGIHHIWGRTLKDITIKYNALNGKDCMYQNGFDAQGMWVEVNVEKSLGLNGKPEILDYGLDNFTNKCMERVKYYANEITNQSKRVGQFMDWDNSYYTNSDSNITAIWAFLKKCNEKGWIVKKNRPMVWCPRCGTSISDHEMTGCYHDVTHTAIFAKLPIKGKDFKMVLWTTTPWTLSANVALAVNPTLPYALVQTESGERLVLGKDALKILKGKYEIVDEFLGERLVGLEYETCFPELIEQQFTHVIVPWDEVDATEGSCVVHIAPGCGSEDFDLGKVHGLKEICPIDEQGVMLANTGFLAGKKTTEVVDMVVSRLDADGKLLYAHKYKHSYPYCWRCKTDLVYRLINTWYIKMDELRPQLIEAVETVNFRPEFAKKRMIDWLNNMGDWNISRSRFYGLPLPFYVCDQCHKVHIIGSMDELREKAIDPSLIDKLPNIHRPWIDDIQIHCECGGTATRIPEVGDCWLDAGITPLSTKKYFTDREFFERNFPNEYVCEMVEQIKLWFYSTLVMSVVMTGKAPYQNLLTYQYVLDENGEEFHKSGGNSLDVDDVADRVSAEAIRYLYAGANPSNDMRFGVNLAEEARKKIIGFWNVYSFFNTYAVIDHLTLDKLNVDMSSMTKIDQWLLDRTDTFINVCKSHYDDYRYSYVVNEFESFVDDISNFYIRSNRRRFWNNDDADKNNAYYCLYHAIKAILQVMSPILPFITDYIWRNLVTEMERDEVSSVHLSTFPSARAVDSDLIAEVAKIREIIYLALKLRAEHKIKVRQPLFTLYVKAEKDYEKACNDFSDIIREELNIKNIEIVSDDTKFNDNILKLNFKTAGAVLKGNVNAVKNMLESASKEQMASYISTYRDGYVDMGEYGRLPSELFTLNIVPKTEFAVANMGNNLVVLDIELTPDLIDEGILRDIIRSLQQLRKDSDFSITDRVRLDITTDSASIARVLEKFQTRISNEVLVKEYATLSDYDNIKTIDIAGEGSMTVKIKAIK